LNFIFPITVPIKKSVEVSEQVGIQHKQQLASMLGFVLNSSSDVYLPPVNLSTGETFQVNWYADIIINAYILTQQQFSDFQKLPDVSDITTYEATGFANRNGVLSYNVSESGSYVAVLVNSSSRSDGYTVSVAEFNESSISHTYQTQNTIQMKTFQQNDNLYLYLGFVFMGSGAIILLLYIRHRKISNLIQQPFPTTGCIDPLTISSKETWTKSSQGTFTNSLLSENDSKAKYG
jgi:hypothetical protein